MQIIHIGAGSTEQPAAEIVGAKAANLARVAALGLPVPPAFVLPIELCTGMVSGDSTAKQQLADGLAEGIEFLETATGKLFGDRRRPLLVSVRSGAAQSMPGMLDTILDVGCTSTAVHGLVRMTGHPRFAFDCRRRFLESYGGVVLGVDPAVFKSRLDELIVGEGVDNERALDGEALERLAASYQQAIEDEKLQACGNSDGAAAGRGRSGISIVGERPRSHRSQARTSRGAGRNGRYGSGDGVRQ